MFLARRDAQPWIAECISSHNRKSRVGYFHLAFFEYFLFYNKRRSGMDAPSEKIALHQI